MRVTGTAKIPLIIGLSSFLKREIPFFRINGMRDSTVRWTKMGISDSDYKRDEVCDPLS